MILPETNIIIREGNLINKSSLNKTNLFMVTGSTSGKHNSELILSDDGRTIILRPYKKFAKGENVTVQYNGSVTDIYGVNLPAFNYSFRISERNPDKNYVGALGTMLEFNYNGHTNLSEANSNLLKSNKAEFYPTGVPTVTVNKSNNPTDGFNFLSPSPFPYPIGYIMIVDNGGIPIFYQKTNSYAADFKLQPNGFLTHFDLVTASFYELDSSYNVVDTFATGNGYTTDLHELRILPNDHSLLMAFDPQPVRMDTIVQGGDSTAIVIGLVIQELDAAKNVIFQWRSWDHFQITDATENIDLTAHTIDYVHGNAIEVDTDGNLIISSRNMDEITKINKQTGDVMWRWGGLKSSNNQFTFINDGKTFSHQHHIRRLPNGNVTIFDNGNLIQPKYSRGAEYQLDEVNKTATLIWSFEYNPTIYSFAMGSTQRLSNGSTIVSWGRRSSDLRVLTEVKYDGSIALEFSVSDTLMNYRAFKFPWKTNLFVTNPDSIFFESVAVGDSAEQTVILKNNSSDSLVITEFYNKISHYAVEPETPFTINENESQPISIKFKPTTEGYFKDILHIRSDSENSRIAQLVILAGRTDTTFSGINDQSIITEFRLEQNYPNPFNPSTVIRFQISSREFVTLKVYDILGKEVATLINAEKSAGNYNVEFNAQDLTSGVYVYRLEAGKFSDVKKLLLLK
jgi:hypothetical protein